MTGRTKGGAIPGSFGQRMDVQSHVIENAALDRLAGLATRVLGVPVSLVSIVEEDRQVFPGLVGLAEPWASRRETPLSHSFCQHVVAARAPLVIDDAREHPLLQENLAIPDLGVVAYAGVPLATPEGRVLGSFCAIDSQPHAWTEWELGILADLAEAAATEIELREQGRRAELAATTLETLNRIGQLVSAELDLDRLVQAVTDAATELTGAEIGAFYFHTADDAGHSYPPYTVSGASTEALQDILLPATAGIFDRTFRGEEVVRLVDVRQDAGYGQQPPSTSLSPEQLPVVSYLAVPVIARSGEVLGGLFFGHPSSGVFDARAEELAVGMAAHAAVAIENARLYEQAQIAEARYRSVFSGVADVILLADGEGNYLDANPAAEALLGYSRAEFLNMRVADVVAGDPQWTETEYARFMEDGHWRSELELRRKDGSAVSVEASATVVELPTGAVYLSAIRDITERRRLEKAHGEFLASASHDLKNPLAALKGQAQLLRRRVGRMSGDQNESLENGLDQIVVLANRMAAQIEELTDVARLRSGQPLELHPDSVDLVAVAEEVAQTHEQASPQHRIRVEAGSFAVSGWWDRLRLVRVVDNLLSNALKYSPEGGNVVVRVNHDDTSDRGWAVLTMRDEGVGIPDADLPYVFDRFRRGKNVAQAIGGTGIGLAGVKQIVEQHGGAIMIDSQESVGTTVTLRLPLGTGPLAQER